MTPIQTYAQAVHAEYKTTIAREHAYRPHLKTLLEALEPNLQAVNDPKHSEGGAPDFIVLRGGIPIAFLEAKDIGVSLDKTAKTDQMGRYRQAYGNLILTDYLEFRWYVDGEARETVKIGERRQQKLALDEAQFPALESLLQRYLHTVVPTVSSAEQLARHMATLTKDIAALTRLYLQDANTSAQLIQQKRIFEQELIPSLTDDGFADMYAQTLAYGLFAARVGFTKPPVQFTLKNAFWELPNTNPFLRQLFKAFATELDPRIERWGDAIAQLLARAKIDDILADFGRRTRQTDPVIHFYETFLSAYNPKEREKRGVYYTPEPVVRYMVRAVDHLLQTQFQRADGLADKNTLILDPATGTGTFLYFVIQHIHEQFVTLGGQAGRWNAYVSDNLLKRVFGFELLMAPYTVAHMKLQVLLRELAYDFKSDERLGVYLTNALEPLQDEQQAMKEGLRAQLSKEAHEASAVKTQKPIMVVIGNPPYSGHSSNEGKWISELIESYYYVDGVRLQERNSKWLRDDYVKFIRMGQERIQRTGEGVLAFVTNHGYLDNPTFRGMRYSLLHTFTDIYLIDLHGNTKKKERTPDGAPDANVFDIQQGVAIGLFVKNPNIKRKVAQVHHIHLYGTREHKYAWLDAHDLPESDWTAVQPSAPFYLFTPQDVTLRGEYERGWKITDVMQTNSVGIVTARDSLTIHHTVEELQETVTKFLELPIEEARQTFNLGKDVRDWSVEGAQKDLNKNAPWQNHVEPILYRPFDTRHTVYTGTTKGFMCMPRREVMQHITRGENIGLVTTRQQATQGLWSLAGVTDKLMESCYISNKTREINYVFPLYIYRSAQEIAESKPETVLMPLPGDDEFPFDDATNRRPNLSVPFVRALESAVALTFAPHPAADNAPHTFSPQDVFHYAYAVFHSPTYRTRYAEFLKIDFPRLPLPQDAAQFRALAAHGAALAGLHLLTHPMLHAHGVRYPQAGTDTVDKGYPQWREGRVYINAAQYFEAVPAPVWAFRVGGYQVLHKWLKDRVGRKLTDAELLHYERMVRALGETLRIMDEIDGLLVFER